MAEARKHRRAGEMNVVITGGAGFLGRRLAEAILDRGEIALLGGPARPVGRVTLLDQVELAAGALGDRRLDSVVADLSTIDAGELSGLPAVAECDVVFHLAAAVSAECEADFDRGWRVNLDGGRAILEAARRGGRGAVFVFASSLAVYGAWPDQPLPPIVTDSTLPAPRSSYGVQKFVMEQLVTDYTRKGYLAGRTVRLMTVSVRPGKPNAAASGFLSSIIREPLAGRMATCPVGPGMEVALSSPESSIAGLLRAASASEAEWGVPTAVNLPAVQTTVGGMVAALAAVAGDAATRFIRWEPDEQVAAVVGSWPARFDSVRARRLGLSADPDFETIVRRYREQYG
jgi:D-erythronate 2-dehydrogenase